MKFLDTTNKIEKVYQKGEFNLELWKKYIATIHPKLGQLCLRYEQGNRNWACFFQRTLSTNFK